MYSIVFSPWKRGSLKDREGKGRNSIERVFFSSSSSSSNANFSLLLFLPDRQVATEIWYVLACEMKIRIGVWVCMSVCVWFLFLFHLVDSIRMVGNRLGGTSGTERVGSLKIIPFIVLERQFYFIFLGNGFPLLQSNL